MQFEVISTAPVVVDGTTYNQGDTFSAKKADVQHLVDNGNLKASSASSDDKGSKGGK